MENTPAEEWYGHKPDLKHLHEFGLVVYRKRLGGLRKLEDRGAKGIFVVYAPNGIRVRNPVTNRVYLARDVKFTDHFDEGRKNKTNEDEIIIENMIDFEENEEQR